MSQPQSPTAKPAPVPNSGDAGKSRYKSTLNLPSTPFPMKANLVQNEPASIKRWEAMGLYERVREARKGREKFVFHDGPPYANGSLHLGHLMNKCLKDFVVRTKTMRGLDCAFVPGWDCHGLPIEHKVVSDLEAAGKLAKLMALEEGARKSAVRRECQKHAEKFHKLHTTQLQRFLTMGDYEHPYLTMTPEYESTTLEVLASLLDQRLVYRMLKPVHWSIANETALAEAELEYYDREDISVYVDFEAADAGKVYDAFGLKHAPDEDDEEESEPGEESAAAARIPRAGVRPHQTPSFMIWTTTPWTLPANLAIAVNATTEYSLVWIDGNVTVIASNLVERVTKGGGAEQVVELARAMGGALLGLRYRHPFVDAKTDGVASPEFMPIAMPPTLGDNTPGEPFQIVPADYVTLEDGTGLVHTAPGHGQEDYVTGRGYGLPAYCPVRGNGTYDNTVPAWLRGLDIWKANDLIVKHLRDSGHLFHDHRFTHSYPHDWRGKTPVIFRCTEQWFVSVDQPVANAHQGMRAMALRAIDPTNPDAVRFVPEWGRNRMRGMLESRPDWCISRQRAWGLPIPAFLYRDAHGNERAFMSAATVRAVAKVVAAKGSDAWFTMMPAQLLEGWNSHEDTAVRALPEGDRAAVLHLAALRKGPDILDVWFESGSSWNAVLRARGLGYPADLYLEGSDQHRGWFQLSMLPALGVTGTPPFKTLLTHGFMVDRDGKKLSKSRPDAHRYEVDSVCTEFGMDVMRWWVASIPYENDVKVDVELFALAGESYRKVRNTLRFMLSNLGDFEASSPDKACGCGRACVPLSSLAPTSLEAWVLSQFDAMAGRVIAAYDAYDFKTAHAELFNFCNDTLSAVYLAAIKDRLYCDRPDSPRRRRTQTVLFGLTDGLCRLLAPIMCHTADEAYRALWKAGADDRTRCVHVEEFVRGFGVKADERWAKVMRAISDATAALEQAKSATGVENPLDAGVVLADPDGSLRAFDPVDLADLLGASEVTLDAAGAGPRVIDLRSRPRCERSWKRDATVRQRSDGGMLSDRDAAALGV